MTEENHLVTPTEEETARYAGASQQARPGEAPEPGPTGELAAARAEAEEWKQKFLRARADLSNYQRRVEQERVKTVRYAIADLARTLLSVLDNLDRVIEKGSEPGVDPETILEGARLTRDSFLHALREFQVHQIEAEGLPFDPQVHEALMEQPSDEHPERTVLQELAKGYRLHDRVLRPAKVLVSRTPAADDNPAQS
jgi:molecular chaperone GrpE